MRNTLADLNDHLFMQLERLNDEEMEGEELKSEIGRAKAVSDVASKVISNGSLVLEGQKMMDNRMDADKKLPRMLEGDKSE